LRRDVEWGVTPVVASLSLCQARQKLVIDLVAKETVSQHESRDVAVEDTMSSSEVRKSMLGHFHGRCPRGWCPNNPYVVGVTDGIAASGKSTAVREVQSTFGAAVIDCDKLGHQTYAKVPAMWRNLSGSLRAFANLIVLVSLISLDEDSVLLWCP
jgi:hypothetical protein